MKTFMLIGALLASLCAIQSAEAHSQRVPRNETWCLETGISSGTMNLCRFTTREQCIASKVAQGDHCELNPILAFEEWNRRQLRIQ